MVGAELHLEALFGLPLGRRHDPGVVEQEIYHWMVVAHLIGELLDGCERRQIELADFHGSRWDLRLHLGFGGCRLLEIASADHDVGSVAGELPNGLESEAPIAAGDDGNLSGQVRNVGCGPRHESTSSRS